MEAFSNVCCDGPTLMISSFCSAGATPASAVTVSGSGHYASDEGFSVIVIQHDILHASLLHSIISRSHVVKEQLTRHFVLVPKGRHFLILRRLRLACLNIA